MSEYPEVKPRVDATGKPMNDIERLLIVLLQIRDALVGTSKQ